MTAFGRRIEFINPDKRPPIPLRFVFQLADKLTPTDITDGLCQRVILDHVLDVEALDADCLVLTNNACREFVLIIPSPISYLSMRASNLEPGLRTVLRPFFLLGKSALCFCQLLLILGKILGIAYLFPCREDHHRLEAQVKPYLRVHHRQGFDSFLDQDGDEVAIGRILCDGHGGRLTSLRQRTAPYDIERRLQPGKRKGGPIPVKGRPNVSSGLRAMLAMEGRILCSSFKEVPEGAIQMPQGLLKGNACNLVQPGILRVLLQGRESSRGVMILDALVFLVVGITAQTQRPVIHETSTAKGTSKYHRLLTSWVKSELIGSFLVHVLHASIYRVESQHESPELPFLKFGVTHDGAFAIEYGNFAIQHDQRVSFILRFFYWVR